MQTLFGLFLVDNAEAAAAEVEGRLGHEAVNVLGADTLRERMAAAQAETPTLAHLLNRKRPVFLGESGSVYAVNELAAHIVEMAQSPGPTKTRGSLKVALEEYGVATHYAEAYTTGIQHGYVLVFADVPEAEIVAVGERFRELGGREVFTFQRLD